MLRNMKDLIGDRIQASDGAIGSVSDFFFDDETWTVRYLVADTGDWLSGRKVLVLTGFLKTPENEEYFPVKITKEQVRSSPDINTDQPIGRHHELSLYEYYNVNPYWNFMGTPIVPGIGGLYVPPLEIGRMGEMGETVKKEDKKGNPSLRSVNEVAGYYIQAGHGRIGHVDDFIVDDETWILRYLVIDTRNWWPGKKVLISPLWVNHISWEEQKVYMDLDREIIKNAPVYDPSKPISRKYEQELCDLYNKPKYW